MNYTSTRDKSIKITSAQAIARGLSRDSGLFVPCDLPKYTTQRLEGLLDKNYMERAQEILSDFLTDFSEQELRDCVNAAYGGGKFGEGKPAPISKLSPDTYMLELWHGPTCAFKDMALQLLPHLLTRSTKKAEGDKEIVILVATSGDTGKAALEGFKDVDGTKIIVFYPEEGVSKVQKLQMTTQAGGNVGVFGVTGNFDDTQTAVKEIFSDRALGDKLEQKGIILSSANSINWGRLVPQIVYYVSAYCDLVADEEIAMGDIVNVTVPTGNFGNILAAYYAKQMGVPLGKLICASNANNVLTDFIATGTYDRRRKFYMTSSPSMDILISSNLERLLFTLYNEDDKAVADLMKQLSENGTYTLSDEVKARLQQDFYGGFCDEAGTFATIKETFDSYSYLCDPHTAVAVAVHKEYVKKTGDNAKNIIASTANPYKFGGSILSALTGKEAGTDEFAQLDELCKLSGMEIPPQILELKDKEVRFKQICKKEEMPESVRGVIGL